MLKRTLAALSLTALPSAALAEPLPTGECASDADCPEGMACEVTGGSSCACEPNVPCDCAPVEYRSCVPGPCASDADCGDGMVCATYEVPCASDAPCTPDGDCPPPEPCEATSQSVCAPRWVLPCAAAADCGEGFTCEPVEMCVCSGGGATPTDPADPGGGSDSDSSDGSEPATPPTPEESSCVCEPSAESWCHAVEIACEDVSVCPAGWSCEHRTTDVPCAEPAEDDNGTGRVPCEAPSEPASTAGVCVPPYGVDFDSDVPRGEGSADSNHESGTASPTDPTGLPSTSDESGLPSPTPGNEMDDGNDTGCRGGATVPIAGLAVLLGALWRRRAQGA